MKSVVSFFKTLFTYISIPSTFDGKSVNLYVTVDPSPVNVCFLIVTPVSRGDGISYTLMSNVSNTRPGTCSSGACDVYSVTKPSPSTTTSAGSIPPVALKSPPPKSVSTLEITFIPSELISTSSNAEDEYVALS